MHKNALFLLKNCKNRPALGAKPPDPCLWRAGGFTPICCAEGFTADPSAIRRLGALPLDPCQNPPLRILGYATEGKNWKSWCLIGKNWEKTLRSTGLAL